MARRQLRRRKERRRKLNELLTSVGLLPPFSSEKRAEWAEVMSQDPYTLRARALNSELKAYQLGRALYHLAQLRHFKGRDLEESVELAEDPDEVAAESEREAVLADLRRTGKTLGQWLADRATGKRKRNIHASRDAVADEFQRICEYQKKWHPRLADRQFLARLEEVIFFQRPVFWRKSTLGDCRFIPGAALCPKGSWLSQQRRMLEKLNNLALAGGNARDLDEEERSAILSSLQVRASLSWASVRSALKNLYRERGEPGAEKRLRFNLEVGGEAKLLGNPLEAKLSRIFGDEWDSHPRQNDIRRAVHRYVWSADYGEIGDQRVVILSAKERAGRRKLAQTAIVEDLGLTVEQASALMSLSLPAGWEPFSIEAIEAFLPELEAGARMGALLNSPEWESWRDETFPGRKRPTGEFLDFLPSPANKEEAARIAGLRNPTIGRTQNELRKVVNNLIREFGKPDLIRIEVTREVGMSKREREVKQAGIRKQERRRKQARKELEDHRIAEPSRDDIEKWLLWEESGHRCPYTGDEISFDALFREGEYEVEHIWPRSRSLDNSYANKTLCRHDVNREKGNKTPYEAFGHDENRWSAICQRLDGMMARKGGQGMSRGKVRRFLATEMPDDFAARQLNDTGHAARQAVAQISRLWPDLGPTAPVRVEAVSGRVTGHLRRLWSLNNILADNGEKTRADHRHHAIDALVVACAHRGVTRQLSDYWQLKDDPAARRPDLQPPWPGIREDAGRAVGDIVVSHRVRKKVSGPLHKETIYGDTGIEVETKSGTYRQFVTRKRVELLSKSEIAADPDVSGEGIRDNEIRKLIQAHVAANGGDPKKAFPPYPVLPGSVVPVRKVRLLSKQQTDLMAQIGTGYADLGSNHHIAIFRSEDGKVNFDVVSLFEAVRRLAHREPVVRRQRNDGAAFVMSLAAGECIEVTKEGVKELRIVQGVWASGVIVTLRHDDADGHTIWRPTAASIIGNGGRKISVDPIGRFRPSND